MTGATGWDAFVLSLRTTPEGFELRVGVVFVLALAGIVWLVINGWDDESDGPKAV